MKISNPKAYLIAGLCSILACLFQIIGLVRYLNRLPEDSLGIGLYILSIIAFTIGAMGFLLQWSKAKKAN